jgi:hypothetical protein
LSSCDESYWSFNDPKLIYRKWEKIHLVNGLIMSNINCRDSKHDLYDHSIQGYFGFVTLKQQYNVITCSTIDWLLITLTSSEQDWLIIVQRWVSNIDWLLFNVKLALLINSCLTSCEQDWVIIVYHWVSKIEFLSFNVKLSGFKEYSTVIPILMKFSQRVHPSLKTYN